MLGAEGFLTDGEGALGNRKGFLVPALPIECTYLQIETRCCFEVALLWEAKVGGVVVQHIQPTGGALLQLIVTANDLEISTLCTLPDG